MKFKHFIFILLLSFSSLLLAQQEKQERSLLFGVILHDSISVENIHIINKTSNIGTFSNSVGKFQIPVFEKDTLLFSSIQFITKTLIVQKAHIDSKFISINLSINDFELDEVIVQDKSYIKNIGAVSLNLPNAGKEPLNKLDRHLNMYSQKSLPVVIALTILGQAGGISNLYNIISGNRKRDRKLKQLRVQDEVDLVNQEKLNEIRIHFKDDFFIHTLQIPKEKIDAFLQFCLPQNIIFLHERERYLEIMDVFLIQKTDFLAD